MNSESRILITGGCGFIGFHTASFLAKRGINVHVIDSFVPYYSLLLKEDRAAILRKMGIPIARIDVADKEQFMSYVEQVRPSHIIHLAAQAGVRHSLVDPSAYLHANIDGFLSVLETVRSYPHIKVVYASSSSVYGTNTKVPFSEEDRADSPANVYGATKKANELFAQAYHHLFQLSLIGLRFFTVYGPFGRPDMAYYLFSDAICQNKEIALFGNGSESRDFTYVDDIVDGIVAATFSPISFGIYNLGNTKPHTVAYLVECLSKSFGKKAKIRYEEQQLGDMEHTCSDIEKAKRDFNFSPRTSIEEGIESFVSWYKAYHIEGVYG